MPDTVIRGAGREARDTLRMTSPSTSSMTAAPMMIRASVRRHPAEVGEHAGGDADRGGGEGRADEDAGGADVARPLAGWGTYTQ